MIKISFIIPIYNAQFFLEKCLDSIINQSMQDIEIICINDGSTDDSALIIEEFSKIDNRIRIFNNEKNFGAGVSRNIGLKHAKGEFVAFVDADDWIESDFSEKLYNHAKYNNSDIVLFNSVQHNLDNSNIKRIYFPNNSFNEDYHNFTFDYTFNKNLILNSFFVIWSKFYKKSFIENFSFPNISLFEDVYFHVSSLLFARRVSYFPEELYHYRKINVNSEQTSKVKTEKIFALMEVFDSINSFLINNGFIDEFKVNFLTFILTESKNNLLKLDSKIQFIFFDKIKNLICNLDINDDELKTIPFSNYQFYIHVINADNYLEYFNFNSSDEEYSDNIYIKEIAEKNLLIKDLKNQLDTLTSENEILLKFQNDFLNNNISFNFYEHVIKLNLFDYNYYENEGYTGDIDPFIHYIYQGFKEGLNPSLNFNTNSYLNNHCIAKKFGLNPLVHFVMDDTNIYLDSLLIRDKIYMEKNMFNLNQDGSPEKNKNMRIIISISSSLLDINHVKYTIFSLFNQSLKPDMIILWLSELEFPNKEKDIPTELLNFENYGLQIKWYNQEFPFLKLIPTLADYPNDLIITVDNNIYYDEKFIERLFDYHLKYPDNIIFNNVDITFCKNKESDYFENLIEYSELPFFHEGYIDFGTLIPPNILKNEMLTQFNIVPYYENLLILALAIKYEISVFFTNDISLQKKIFVKRINTYPIKEYVEDIFSVFPEIKDNMYI